MSVIPDGYGQINWKFVGGAAPTGAEVTMGFFNVESEEDPLVLATAAEQVWRDQWLDIQTASLTLASVLCKLGPNEFGPSAEFASGVAGGEDENVIDPNAALLVKKRTGFGGRTGRGRMYIPAFPEDAFGLGGEVNVTPLGVYQTRAADFLTDMAAAGMSCVVLHGPDSPITIPTTITSLEVDSKLATQRRRLRR